MALLTREQFLATTGRKTKDIGVDALGGTVRIAAISADTLFKFRELSKRRDRGQEVEIELMTTILVGSIVDESNREMLTEADVPALLKMAPDVVTTLFKESMELNGLRPKEEPKAEGQAHAAGDDAVPTVDPVEDARKNS